MLSYYYPDINEKPKEEWTWKESDGTGNRTRVSQLPVGCSKIEFWKLLAKLERTRLKLNTIVQSKERDEI